MSSQLLPLPHSSVSVAAIAASGVFFRLHRRQCCPWLPHSVIAPSYLPSLLLPLTHSPVVTPHSMSSQLLPLRHFPVFVVAVAASATFFRLRHHHSCPCCIFPSARRRPAFAIATSAAFFRRHAAFHIVAVADSAAFSRLPSPPLLPLPHSSVSVVAIAALAAFSHGNAQTRLRYCCLCRIL